MNDVPFPEPVVLDLPGTGARKVATSFEAIECLQNEWPQWARGKSWRRAELACRDALDGWRSAKMARKSFARAADRAGLTHGRRRRIASAWQGPVGSAALNAGAAAGQ